jgi:hypothetical protein
MSIAPLAILGIAIATGIGGGLVMLLWNWLMPALFSWPQVTFWQALGLLALCRILLGGLGGHCHAGSLARRRVRERVEERLAALAPEERERLRQRMRDRCGLGPATGEGQGQ